MALTIGYEGIGIIANADSATESIGTTPGTWNEDGLGTDSWSPDTYIQGSESFAGAYSGKSGYQYFQTATAYNFTTGGNAEGQYIYMWVNCPTLGLMQTKASNGIALRLGSDLNNYRDYTIGGNDDSNGWLGDWKCFIIDPNTAGTTGQGAGTFNPNNVNYIGVWVDAASTAKGDNIFIDQIAIASGLRITGTSTTGWAETITYCTDYANQAVGSLQEKSGIYYAQGNIYIGDTAQTAATSFEDSGRVIKWDTSQYWTGTVWASLYPTTGANVYVEDAGSFATTFTDGVIVGTDNGRAGSTFIGSVDQNVTFDFTGLTNTSSDVNLYGTRFKSLYGGVLFEPDIDHVAYGCAFNDCAQVVPNTTVLRNCTFAETASTSGAMLWSSGVNVQSTNFIANTTGAAIQIATDHGADGQEDFTALTFSGNTFDVNNTTGSALTVNKLSGSNPSTFTGSSVTFSATFTLTMTDIPSGVAVTIVNSSTRTELSHQVSAGTNLTYGHAGGETVDILLNGLAIDPNLSDVYDLTLDNGNQTIKFQTITDLNYANP